MARIPFKKKKKKKSVKLNFAIITGKMFISFQSYPVRKLHFYLQTNYTQGREIKPLRTIKSTIALPWIHGPNQQPV